MPNWKLIAKILGFLLFIIFGLFFIFKSLANHVIHDVLLFFR